MRQLEQTQKVWLYIISIIAAIIAFYLFNPSHYYFLNDDLIHIPLSKEGVLFQRNSFRPVCDLSIRLDYLLWQKNAWGYHLSNLLLHVTNSLLLFLFTKVLYKRYTNDSNANIVGLLVAVLFFVYAFHSETIFWILGRSASLGLLFFLCSVIFYLKRHHSILYPVLSLLMFSVGLLTYESNWIFPLAAIIISVVDRKRFRVSIKREALYIALILVLFIVYLASRYTVLGEIAGAYEATHFTSFNMAAIVANFLRLFARCFVPSFQNSTYFVICIALFFLTVVIVAFLNRNALKKSMITGLIVMLLLVSFIPYLSLGIDTHTVEGERFLYMPSAFASLLLVCLIYHLSINWKQVLLIFSFLITYHLVFLARSHNYYSTASKISSITFQEVNKLQGKKTLFIDSLPQMYNGALIFRLGFEEGLNWLKQPGTVDSVIVTSLKHDNSNWSKHYMSSSPEFLPNRAYDSILIRFPKGHQGYFKQAIPVTSPDYKTDALFIYNDNTLQVIK